jgi:predicted phosphate transport protein (TIGR00153 family)
MKLNLFLPKQPAFFDLFTKQGQAIFSIAKLLGELCQAQDRQGLTNCAVQAKKIEQQADFVIKEIVRNLNLSFITPFDREDIHSLAGELDDIVDDIENIVHNIGIYQVNHREKFIADFAALITQDAQYLVQLIELLNSQKYSDAAVDLIDKIHKLEDDGDELFVSTLSYLFGNEKNAISIIKLKDIAENLEKVLDRFQNASTTIENIFIKI